MANGRAVSQARLGDLPKVDAVLKRPEVLALDLPRWAVVEAVRREIDGLRQAILEGKSGEVVLASDTVARTARVLARPSLRGVINATGVVLHTNLGRAPLAEEAVTRVAEIARGYSNLEYDVGERARGSRHDHLQALLADLTGAEASVVVNNCAAAVLISLAALANGREVVVSRGELIEIGGSFRIPDVMRQSGARLVEVGTTNKTHLRDFEAAVGPDTALVLKVHRSNFAIVGFTAEVSAEELVRLGNARGVPVMIDLGSGTLVDTAAFEGAGRASEPTVSCAVRSGAALVAFSGDKLLGGPQAGLIVGTAAAVALVKQHPLMRALRPDKMTLAALEATLELYRAGVALERVPALRMLAARHEDLRARADDLQGKLATHPSWLHVERISLTSAVGGGALPTSEPPSFGVALTADGRSANDLDALLRRHDPPIVARIIEARLVLDVRTLTENDALIVAAAVSSLGG